uniref:glutathione transferase n=1 Tax=Graphocephala atropunctata TaxID=36148 RepID=A0A1B6K9G4_9HEMI
MAGESKIKLTYFSLIGLAEPIRFLLSYLKKDFEDYRFGGKEWLTIKPTTPWGKSPILEINGQTVTQNVAICRYLGKEAGLGGKDNWEDLRIDEIIDVITDLRTELWRWHYERDLQKKEAMKDSIKNEIAPFYMKKLDEHVAKNNGYLANGKFSWADIYYGGLSDCLTYLLEAEITDGYPNMKALKEKVHALPAIKAWIDKRPPDDLTFKVELGLIPTKK